MHIWEALDFQYIWEVLVQYILDWGQVLTAITKGRHEVGKEAKWEALGGSGGRE